MVLRGHEAAGLLAGGERVRVLGMKLFDRLLDRAVAALPAEVRDHVVVFGSAPMVFAGLKPDVTVDLDLFASDEAYAALLAKGFAEDADERGMPRIMVADAVEVVREWPGLAFAEVFAAAAPREGSRGLRVASLAHVLAWKAASAREKDRVEAEIVRRALA